MKWYCRLSSIGLLLLTVACAEIEPALICSAPVTPQDEYNFFLLESKRSFLAPDPLFESARFQQTMSARQLKEMSPERVALLKSWRIPFGACGAEIDDPVPMASKHALSNLLLRKSGGSSFSDLKLSNECWATKLEEDAELFKRDVDDLFCDSLDAALVINTKSRAEDDLEPCVMEEGSETDRAREFFERLCRALSVKSEKFYAYRYMEGPLSILAAVVLEVHKGMLDRGDRQLVQDFSLRIVYDTDTLFVQVSKEHSEIQISAPVLRTAYALALKQVETEMAALRKEYEDVRHEKKRLGEFKRHALNVVDELSDRVYQNYFQLIAFIMSHELAHIYKSNLNDEGMADCFGVANMVLRHGANADAEIFSMVVDDYAGAAASAWRDGLSDQERIYELSTRRDRLKPLLQLKSKKGGRAVQKECRNRFESNQK